MTDKIDDATPTILRAIQAQLAGLEQKLDHHAQMTDRKLGVMSQSLNSIRVGQHSHGEQLARLSDDLQTIAMAVDEHGNRLAQVEDRLGTLEDRLGTVEQRLTTIERHLPITRQ